MTAFHPLRTFECSSGQRSTAHHQRKSCLSIATKVPKCFLAVLTPCETARAPFVVHVERAGGPRPSGWAATQVLDVVGICIGRRPPITYLGAYVDCHEAWFVGEVRIGFGHVRRRWYPAGLRGTCAERRYEDEEREHHPKLALNRSTRNVRFPPKTDIRPSPNCRLQRDRSKNPTPRMCHLTATTSGPNAVLSTPDAFA